MGCTLGEAARAAGISKASVVRAIKSGRLSAPRREDGTYSIEPSELLRVYPATGVAAGPMRRSETGIGAGPPLVQVMAKRDQYGVLAEEREETIRDLRRRSTTARPNGRVQERLTAPLTHRQTGSVPSVQKSETVSDSRRPWWRRVFRCPR